MPLPKARITLRTMMATVFVVSVLLAIMIHWIRYERIKAMVINQEITLNVAEVNVLNAALAHENAELAAIEFVKNNESLSDHKMTSAEANGEDRLLQSLSRQVELTNTRRRELKAVWGYERLKLKRLKWEIEHIWTFWPSGLFLGGTTERKWNLSEQEAAEIDARLKHFGMPGD